MKIILLLSILIVVIIVPTVDALTPEDLNEIRLLIKEELEPIKTEISKLNERVAGVEGRVEGLEKMMTWLMVLIVVVVGVPQLIAAWRTRKEKEQDKKIEDLTREIELLKQQRIAHP